jgi:integrase
VETIGLRWAEIAADGMVWTVPAGRIKMGREHRVPLSGPARGILEAMRPVATGEYVFPGLKPARPLSNMAMAKLLERMKCADVTVHGFRSTFRTWAGEKTNYPRDLCEAALAHAQESAVEEAYQRGDKLERRRELMAAWAAYCTEGGAQIIRLAS